MIERIRIRNFQRYEDFRVVLDERVTTFVGPSDGGKSAVMRAVKWTMTNRPSGSTFVRHGEKEASVTLWLDGHRLSRRKGKGLNKFVLDGEDLEAFGKNKLPESVRLLCNVDETNFQGQHDPPFWLSLTAGQASRELNEVVNLHEIDRVMGVVVKREKRAKVEVELCAERAEKAKRDCESLSWVSEMEAEWREIEEKRRKYDSRREELDRVGELFDEVQRLGRAAKVEVPDTRELDGLVGELEKGRKKLEAVRAGKREIFILRKQAVSVGRELETSQKRLEAESGGICPLCGGVIH